MNSSCFIICELNWIVFMAIVKHFRVKMRLAFFCCANLIKYEYTFCLVSLLFSLIIIIIRIIIIIIIIIILYFLKTHVTQVSMLFTKTG